MHSIIVAIFVATSLSTAVNALSTNILIPLYVYPAPGAWDSIYNAVRNYPSLQFQIVLNPSTGPGSSSSVGYDPNWINGTSRLNSFHNVQTLGYVHLFNGTETVQDVETNITTWASWASYSEADDIAVRGVFFDEAPAADTSYMQVLTEFAYAQLGPRTKIVFNPGTVSDTDYFSMADHVIVSEVTAEDYSPSILQTSVLYEYASQASILVHDFVSGGGSRKQLRSWLEGMAGAGIGSVNIVDYGWDASNTDDGPADVGSVADLLVEAGADCRRGRSVLAPLLPKALAGMSKTWWRRRYCE